VVDPPQAGSLSTFSLGPSAVAPPGTGQTRSNVKTGLLLWVCAFVFYAGIGMWLTLHFNLVDGDGPSRVADGGYVLFSRNPHLGAIGFIWNPLPSMAEIPFLLFKGLWPALQAKGQAGTLQSSLFMASAVWQIYRLTLDRKIPNPWRWVLIAGFALSPMIVLYGGNALSEAALVFCTTWAARRLMLWMEDRNSVHLAMAGIALGVGYLARYEALFAGVFAIALVVATSAYREGILRRERRRAAVATAMHDGVLIGFPLTLTFLGWAVAGWLLTGQAFQQFTSQYGNSSQLKGSHVVVASGVGQIVTSLEDSMRAIVSIEPLLPTVLVVVAAITIKRRSAALLAPLAVFGGVLAFEIAAQAKGLTFGWFRFYITTIPLCVCALAIFWPRSIGPAEQAQPRRWRGLSRHTLWGLAALAVLLPSFPVTWSAMLNPAIGNQFDQTGLRYIFTSASAKRYTYPQFDEYRSDRALAAWLDAQRLPRASVLLDTFQGWEIWLSSKRPQQFVITSDYDFLSALDDPARYGIRYILDSNPAVESVDAVNRRYPRLWSTGGGISMRVLTVNSRSGPPWRVFRVIGGSGDGLR